MKLDSNLSTVDRIVDGLKNLHRHDEVFFEPCQHKISVIFAGEPGYYEAPRVLDFYNFLKSHTYREPFISSMSRGCLKVAYGYNELKPREHDRLQEALRSTILSQLAGSIGISQVKYGEIGWRFDNALCTMERGLIGHTRDNAA